MIPSDTGATLVEYSNDSGFTTSGLKLMKLFGFVTILLF
jgi:hypothetical protein